VQLHPVDMQNRPHKTACQHSEPPLVKGDEAHDIPRRRGRGGSAQRGHPLWLRVTGERAKQTLSNKGLQVVTPRILQLNFFFSLLAKIRALPFPFLFPLAKP
jgi:hypothetical protein